MRRTDGQSQWNSVAGNRGCSGRLGWFRGSMGFASPPHELQPELGRCLDPFWMPLFFFALSKRGDDAGSNNGCWVSRLLPSPASLEPNRSIWDVGNKNLTDDVAPLSTMDGFPGLPARRGEVTEGAAVNARRPRHLDKTPCGLCGLSAGEEPFFFLSVRLPWPNIPPPPDAMPGAMARMRDEHITTPRDPNHLGQASLDSGPG